MKQLTRFSENYSMSDFLSISGSTEMGIRNGKGIQKFKDGCIFIGKWIDNKPHGYGQLVFPDGTTLTGNFESGIIKYGRLKHLRGLSYIGEFHTVGFKSEGFKKGRVEFSNGDYFLGEWSDSTLGIIKGTFYGKKDQSVKKFEIESRLVIYDSDCFGKIIERDFIYEGQIKHDYIFGTGVVFKFDGICFEEQNSPVQGSYCCGEFLTQQVQTQKLSEELKDLNQSTRFGGNNTSNAFPRNAFLSNQGGEANFFINEGFYNAPRQQRTNMNGQGLLENNGMMRINGQNYNTPSGKLDGLQREMIFSHFSDKHVIMEQVYENGKKVMHSNVFSNGIKISFTNENLPKKISFINPDFQKIASNIPHLLYKDKVLKLLKENKNLSAFSNKKSLNRLRIASLRSNIEFEESQKESKNDPQIEMNKSKDFQNEAVKSQFQEENKDENVKEINNEKKKLCVENVVLEGNVDDIANPTKGDGFMKIHEQEIFLEFEITKKKKVLFSYMGKKVRGVKKMLAYVEKEIWGDDWDNGEETWGQRLKTFRTTMSELEENDENSEEDIVYLDLDQKDLSQGIEEKNNQKMIPILQTNLKKYRSKKKLRKVRIKYFDDVYFEGLLENDYVKCHKNHLKDAFNLNNLLKKHREILKIPYHFSGNIINGQKEGFCKEIYEDGSVFEGFYQKGRRCGKGFFRDVKDSSMYIGNFQGDEIQGQGVKIEDEGDKLVGQFEEGSLVKGVIEYQNGVKYVGDLSNGVRHGKGKLMFNNDYVFEGQFVHDQISTAFEKGVLVDSKQNKYSCTYDESSNGTLKFFTFENEQILFIDKKNGELISFL